jgi:hypothetical protein
MVAGKARMLNNYQPSSYTADIGGYSGADEMGYDAMVSAIGEASSSQNKILELQNFLRNPPFTLFNLAPSSTGEITFTANLKPYTQLFILAVDQNSVA